MTSRLFVGFVLGLLAGGAVAAGLVFGLHTLVFDGSIGVVLAFAGAALTGALTGLVAGKPIWAHGASIEAGLKAVFGAILGTVAMFALRKWTSGVHVDLSALGIGGAGGLGDVPAASLPLLGAALGGLFELDNTGDDPKAGAGGSGSSGSGRVRVATGKAAIGEKRRAAPAPDAASDEDQHAGRRAKG